MQKLMFLIIIFFTITSLLGCSQQEISQLKIDKYIPKLIEQEPVEYIDHTYNNMNGYITIKVVANTIHKQSIAHDSKEILERLFPDKHSKIDTVAILWYDSKNGYKRATTEMTLNEYTSINWEEASSYEIKPYVTMN